MNKPIIPIKFEEGFWVEKSLLPKKRANIGGKNFFPL